MPTNTSHKKTVAKWIAIVWMAAPAVVLGDPLSSRLYNDTWGNWEKRLDQAFDNFFSRKMPGKALGILVPNDPRLDILSLTAYGYEIMAPPKAGTVVMIMPAPSSIADRAPASQ